MTCVQSFYYYSHSLEHSNQNMLITSSVFLCRSEKLLKRIAADKPGCDTTLDGADGESPAKQIQETIAEELR